jgi:hypothetical protein
MRDRMPSIHRQIWRKFHIHRGDNPPFFAWNGHRSHLGELFRDLGYKKGAEIGVQRGNFSKILLDANPGLHLKCIDPWSGYYYYAQTTDEHAKAIFEVAKAQLAPYDVEFIQKTSMEAVKEIPDESLDFVYIDAMHDFDNVMMDLICWVPKVRRGGIVSGHDYCVGYMVGVIDAVNTYTRVHNVNLYYCTREREPSWFFVKE